MIPGIGPELAQRIHDTLHVSTLEQLDAAADLTDANVQAATRLGAPFKIYAAEVSPFRVEVAKRIAVREAAAGPAAGTRA